MSSAPKAPDYAAAAEKTAAASLEATKYQTMANRPNTTTPWGTDTWTTDPNTGASTRRITLDPAEQAALDAQQGMDKTRSQTAGGMMNRVKRELGRSVDFSKFENYGSLGDPNIRRQHQEDAAYGRATSRLDPYWHDQVQSTDVELRNQGLNPGDEAYDKAMANTTRARTDAYSAAQNDAVTQGRAESDLSYGQDLGTANYSNNLRTQQITEELQKRGWSLNEINALVSGQQIGMPQAPSNQPNSTAARAQSADYSTAAQQQYQSSLDKLNAEQAGIQGMFSGAGGIAQAYMMSDMRLKSNIKHVGIFKHYNVYEYDIAGTRTPGVMAQEVLLTNPEAVSEHESGYLMVNYGAL
jgi:hypothetical protein